MRQRHDACIVHAGQNADFGKERAGVTIRPTLYTNTKFRMLSRRALGRARPAGGVLALPTPRNRFTSRAERSKSVRRASPWPFQFSFGCHDIRRATPRRVGAGACSAEAAVRRRKPSISYFGL